MDSDFVFRLDRHRRFLLGPSLALDQILWADCPASDCADRPLSGRDFASPATSSVNHSRDNPSQWKLRVLLREREPSIGG